VQGAFGAEVFHLVRGGADAAAAPGGYEAALPGTVLDVAVAPGEAVAAGQTLLTLESMKMEIAVSAAGDGTVTEIAVVPGDHVERGQILAVVEPTEQGANR